MDNMNTIKLDEWKAIPPNKRIMDLTEKILDQNSRILDMNHDLLRVLSCLPMAYKVSKDPISDRKTP